MSKLALPLNAIRSSHARGAIDGLIARKREIDDQIKELIGSEEEEGTLLYELKEISSKLIAIFLKHDLEKVRMPDGTSISKSVTTTSRISPEKLLEHKVSMAVIEACTETTTSKPYVRVYYPTHQQRQQEWRVKVNTAVPTTDEEVFDHFKSMFKSDLVVKNLAGIYRIQRMKGKNVLDSYEYTFACLSRILHKEKTV